MEVSGSNQDDQTINRHNGKLHDRQRQAVSELSDCFAQPNCCWVQVYLSLSSPEVLGQDKIQTELGIDATDESEMIH